VDTPRSAAASVELANSLNALNLFISKTLIFISWWRSRHIEPAICFAAFIIPAASSLINTMLNQGLLPRNAAPPISTSFYQLASAGSRRGHELRPRARGTASRGIPAIGPARHRKTVDKNNR